MKPDMKKIWECLNRYKLVLLMLAAGVLLLLWPSGNGKSAAAAEKERQTAPGPNFDLEALEAKLERVLSKIDGAGEVTVALSVKDGVEQVYATNESLSKDGNGQEQQRETVRVSTGSGTEEVVPVQQRYPAFQGAVVVCQGGGSAEIRLLVTQAVAALTGLGTDRISVCKSG